MDSTTATTKIATLVEVLHGRGTGEMRLYRLAPPMTGTDWDDTEYAHEYVVVSATVVPFGSGPETYIFPADRTGEITAWGELPGSYRGGLDHAEALRGAGYEVSA